MRKRRAPEEQGSLFERAQPRAPKDGSGAVRASAKRTAEATRTWRMPELAGRTIAEIRVRWTKRLTPAQVARVEAELGALSRSLSKLGFGDVHVERVFVRRRRA